MKDSERIFVLTCATLVGAIGMGCLILSYICACA